MINAIISFFTANLILNSVILGVIVVLLVLLYIFKKDKLILWGKTVALMIKVELENSLKGADKFEKVMNLIKSQAWYNKSFLRFIPDFIFRTLVQTIFNKNKEEIENVKK